MKELETSEPEVIDPYSIHRWLIETQSSPTALVGSDDRTAWSQCDDDDSDKPQHSRVVSVALVVLLLSLAAVATWFATTFYDEPVMGTIQSQPVTTTVSTPPPTDEPPQDYDLPSDSTNADTVQPDSRFIALLDTRGITVPPDAPAFRAAHLVCTDVATGMPRQLVATLFSRDNHQFDMDYSMVFVDTAIDVFCPGGHQR